MTSLVHTWSLLDTDFSERHPGLMRVRDPRLGQVCIEAVTEWNIML